MIYVRRDGKMVDRQIHYPLIERGRNRTLLKDYNVQRLINLGVPEDIARKSLKR